METKKNRSWPPLLRAYFSGIRGKWWTIVGVVLAVEAIAVFALGNKWLPKETSGGWRAFWAAVAMLVSLNIAQVLRGIGLLEARPMTREQKLAFWRHWRKECESVEGTLDGLGVEPKESGQRLEAIKNRLHDAIYAEWPKAEADAHWEAIKRRIDLSDLPEAYMEAQSPQRENELERQRLEYAIIGRAADS